MGMSNIEMSFAARLATTVGQEIRRRRMQRGLTQQQLAAHLDSHRPIISRIEHGRHAADLDTYARIARVLGTNLPTLLLCIDGMVP